MLEKMNLYPGEVDPFWYTLAYLGLGETDKALNSIAEGLEVSPSHTAWLMRTPLLYARLVPCVYGLLPVCKHYVQLRQGTTAYVYPVSLMMPFSLASDPDGLFARRFPNVFSSSSAHARHGFFRRRFNLFAIKQCALQS